MNLLTTYKTTFHILEGLPLMVVLGLTIVGLAGCSRGIDRTVVTTADQTAYRASLDQVAKGATKEQMAAYDWAVSDLTLPKLKEQYPDRSARDIIRGETTKVLRELPPRIEALQAKQQEWERAASKVAAVSTDHEVFELDKDFFGLQPTITASVHNGSPYSFTSYSWTALLYIEGSNQPVAKALVTSVFTHDDGSGQALDPGKTEAVRMVVGFVSGDQHWKTAEIQRAQARRIVLIPAPEHARDLGGRPLVDEPPTAGVDLDGLRATVQQAKAYENL